MTHEEHAWAERFEWELLGKEREQRLHALVDWRRAHAVAVEREALERAAVVADRWATDAQRRHGNGGPAAEILALAAQGRDENAR